MITRLIYHVAFAGILLVNSSAARGQPFYFRHYQVENGLSNNTVYCLAQDSRGFMWFGTKDGLNRFDGYHFKVYRVNKAEEEVDPNADYIHAILPDKNGDLWIGAERGLYRFQSDKEILQPFIDSLHNITAILSDPGGRLWFISDNILRCYSMTDHSLRSYAPPRYSRVSSLCLSHNGNIWVSTPDGYLECLDKDQQRFSRFDLFSHSPAPTSRSIQCIKPGAGNSLYIGTSSQGIKQFDIDDSDYHDIVAYSPDRTSLFVRDIIRYNKNEFWFATESGIFILDAPTRSIHILNKEFTNPYSLNDNAVYSLCKDTEGSIWAGTYFGGINYYARQNAVFRKYFPDNSQNRISGNAVREICRDQFGNLWIGTEDNGLNKLNPGTGHFEHFEPTGKKTSIAYRNIHGLLADGNHLWIGTFEHGIDIMDITTGKIIRHFTAGPGPHDLKSNFGLCFLKTRSGRIYIGTSNGLYEYDPSTGYFLRPPGIPGNLFVLTLLEDENNKVWVGSHDHHGVFWFNPETNKYGSLEDQPGAPNSIANKTVNDILEDSHQNLWMATEGGGIACLSSDRQHYTWYTTKSGLPGNFIFKILEDNEHHIWASTSRGLVRYDPHTKTVEVFTRSNGLLTDQFNYHSGYKDPQGRLYFGSVKGMISFQPEDLPATPFVPPIFITGFQVFNRDLNLLKDSSEIKQSIINARQVVLPYYQSTLSIDFAALSYVAPEMTEYSFRLRGLNNEWTTIKNNRKAYFTNLSPGRYTFEVKAATGHAWTPQIRTLNIIIRPPFWLTTWAILTYVIVGILIVVWLFRNYHRRHQNKKERELYKSKIEFFTNVAHEIRTPLTLIRGPVENLMQKEYEIPDMKEDIECLDRNTNRLIKLAAQILDFHQTEINSFALDFSEVNVSEILNETYLSFKVLAHKRKLHYELKMPAHPLRAIADAEALQKIFSNLIGNAVKYSEKRVDIIMYPATDSMESVTIDFMNDGTIIPMDLKEKIFEPFYRMRESGHQKGTGIGLTLARSLTQLHGGSLTLQQAKKRLNLFRLVLPLQPGSRSGKPAEILKSSIPQ